LATIFWYDIKAQAMKAKINKWNSPKKVGQY